MVEDLLALVPNPSCVPNLKLLASTVAEINSLLWLSTVVEIRACLPVGGATSSACRRRVAARLAGVRTVSSF